MGMEHNWFTITHQCGLSAREHHLLLHLYFPRCLLPRALVLRGDSEGADLPHKHLPSSSSSSYPPPSSLYLFARGPKTAQHREKIMGGGVRRGSGVGEEEEEEERKRAEERGREGGRYTNIHYRSDSTHVDGDVHAHTLLVEHLNHISCLPDIHHSHRQKHMAERHGNCMATCITTHKQTRSRSQSSQHTLKPDDSVRGESNPSSHTIFPNQKSTCIHLHAHHCQHTSSVHSGDPLIRSRPLPPPLLLLCARQNRL